MQLPLQRGIMVGQAELARTIICKDAIFQNREGTHISLAPGLSSEFPPRHGPSLICTNASSERALVLSMGMIFGHLTEEATTDEETDSVLVMAVVLPDVLIR